MLPVRVIGGFRMIGRHCRQFLGSDRALEIGGKVHTFAAGTADHHECRILVTRIGTGDCTRIVAHREFTDVEGQRRELIHCIVAGRNLVKIVSVQLGQRIVDLETLRGERFRNRGALTRIARAGACAAPNGVYAATAKQ